MRMTIKANYKNYKLMLKNSKLGNFSCLQFVRACGNLDLVSSSNKLLIWHHQGDRNECRGRYLVYLPRQLATGGACASPVACWLIQNRCLCKVPALKSHTYLPKTTVQVQEAYCTQEFRPIFYFSHSGLLWSVSNFTVCCRFSILYRSYSRTSTLV